MVVYFDSIDMAAIIAGSFFVGYLLHDMIQDWFK